MNFSRKQWFYLAIIISIIIDFSLLIYVMFYPVDPSFKSTIYTFDVIICIIMWAEFIYSYKHSQNKKQYIGDNYLSIAGMLPLDFMFLRGLRLIKLVNFIKKFALTHESEAIEKFLKRTLLDKILSIAIIFIFVVAILIRLDSNINDFPTALWYTFVSMTSTGYGDVVPATLSGRLIGIIAMVGGIIIFATITAVISSIYVSKISRDHHEDVESKIEDLTSEIERLNEKIDELKKE
ncbi:potassium channel family protein [Methanobrevibacter sp.]|uniref:potassium channel family protein n=1 Tax=Methanobrevibacter sp. TaxID=66852 RepID=UPI00388D1015